MSKVKKTAFIVLALAGLANFIAIYSQYQLSPFAPQLMKILNMPPVQFSSVFTASFIPGVFLSLVAGILADRFGLKRVVGIGIATAVAGSCLRIFSSSYMSMMICMILIGVCGTMVNANSAKLIGSYFSREKGTAMMSVYQSSASIAMIVAMSTTSLFGNIQGAFTVAAIICVVIAVLWFLLVKEPEKKKTASAPELPKVSMVESLKIVVKSKNIWFTTFALTGVMACVTGINVFLPTALSGRGIDTVQAGLISSMMLVGNFLGCLVIPFIANKIGRNKPILIICAIIGAAGAAFAWKAPEGLLLIASLFITGGSLSAILPILVIVPVQLKEIGPQYAGTAGGFVTTLKILGTMAIPSYIIAPITGTNMDLYYCLCGLCVVVTLVMVLLIPDFGKKAVAEQQKTHVVTAEEAN